MYGVKGARARRAGKREGGGGRVCGFVCVCVCFVRMRECVVCEWV